MNINSKSGISRIGADHAKANQCKRQKDAKKQQRAVLQPFSRRYFDAFNDPVGSQIQNSGDQCEIDYLQELVLRSGAQFPDTGVIRDQENIGRSVRKNPHS